MKPFWPAMTIAGLWDGRLREWAVVWLKPPAVESGVGSLPQESPPGLPSRAAPYGRIVLGVRLRLNIQHNTSHMYTYPGPVRTGMV